MYGGDLMYTSWLAIQSLYQPSIRCTDLTLKHHLCCASSYISWVSNLRMKKCNGVVDVVATVCKQYNT